MQLREIRGEVDEFVQGPKVVGIGHSWTVFSPSLFLPQEKKERREESHQGHVNRRLPLAFCPLPTSLVGGHNHPGNLKDGEILAGYRMPQKSKNKKNKVEGFYKSVTEMGKVTFIKATGLIKRQSVYGISNFTPEALIIHNTHLHLCL